VKPETILHSLNVANVFKVTTIDEHLQGPWAVDKKIPKLSLIKSVPHLTVFNAR
jgi:hypothetical protein